MLVLDAGARVTQLRFLPDGRLLVGLLLKTGGAAVDIRPVGAGEPHRIYLRDSTWVSANQLAVHPSGGRFSVAAHSLRTFATADGSPVPAGPAVYALEVAAAPDGEWLLTTRRTPAGDTTVAAVYGDGSRRLLATYPSEGNRRLAGVSPDGERFVVVGQGEVRVEPLAGAVEPIRARYPSSHVYHPGLSPDGRYLAAIGYSSMYVYDLPVLGKPRLIKGASAFGNFVGYAFHPGGRMLAVIHGGPTLVKLYDLDTLTLRTKLNWKVGPLTCVAFSPDGLLAAAGSEDGRVVVWDVDG
ncbi:hypothetical protein J0H58_37845 [bacterium]|nr:hypothetical protein [bacterium]